MKYRVDWRYAALLALLILLVPVGGRCQTARQQMQKEIDRISTAVNAKPDEGEWKDNKPDIVNSLKDAREALKAGRLFAALENLGDAWANLVTAETMLDKSEIVKQGMPGFLAEWRRTNGQLKELNRRSDEGEKNPVPLAVKALGEVNRAMAKTYYNSSRAYAEAITDSVEGSVKAGLNVLGAAKGSLEFAIFCETLHFTPIPVAPALRSIAPEIQELEKRMIAAYQPPRSTEHHGEFILMHSALKEAGDLELAHEYPGALYRYLDALQMLEALEGPPAGDVPADELQKKAHKLRAEMASGKDNSLVELFLQRSESMSGSSAEGGKAPSSSHREQIVLNRVVPAYYAALEKRTEPVGAAAQTIKVTLVRWPYT